ncbi:MAG TPA: hypothetical protein VFY78_13465 [Gammaproteobacteria bacterium]|nr:hypothetical protein [Gammaproteobacteria bacterium]
MLCQKKSVALLTVCLLATSGAVLADGVFLGRSIEAHELTNTESAQLDAELARQFGSPTPETLVKSNNPWDAKKKQTQNLTQKKASWGDCRDYALQQRNLCYKEGRDAYSCERYYEARTTKCDKKY